MLKSEGLERIKAKKIKTVSSGCRFSELNDKNIEMTDKKKSKQILIARSCIFLSLTKLINPNCHAFDYCRNRNPDSFIPDQ